MKSATDLTRWGSSYEGMICSFRVLDTLNYLLPVSTSVSTKPEVVRRAEIREGSSAPLEVPTAGDGSIPDMGSRQTNRYFVLSLPR